jgi:hypothetical protein
MIFWKEAWLKRVDEKPAVTTNRGTAQNAACTEATLIAATRREHFDIDGEELFSCQATELPRATTPLAWWDVRQYVRDLASGNVGAAEFVRGFAAAAFNLIVRNLRHAIMAFRRRVVPVPLVKAETVVADGPDAPLNAGLVPRATLGGPIVGALRFAVHNVLVEYPHIRGELHKTPAAALDLQPGELVQVRTKAEILATLDINSRNRGLLFDVEMVPYCGSTHQVLRRVEQIINEKTGRMMRFSTPSIVLDGVFCRGCLSRSRLFCPRSIYSYWREIWLKRAV